MFFFGWSIHRSGSNAINIQYVLKSYCWLSLLLRVVDALHPNEVSMGTTILAVRYKDGVVVGADTRTSVSGYVSNRYAVSGLSIKAMFVFKHSQGQSNIFPYNPLIYRPN